MGFVTRLDDERALARCEHSWLRPPEYDEPTCKCGEFPSYQIDDLLLCEGCVWDFVTETEPEKDEYCEYCGEDEVDEGYRVQGDFYCKECFEKAFRI